MRLMRVFGLFCLVALACADIKAVLAVAQAINAEYHVPVNVTINDDHRLTVTLKNALTDLKLSDDDRANVARRVAAFAVAHYHGETTVSDVRVEFENVASAGPVTMTRTDTPYTFKASELK